MPKFNKGDKVIQVVDSKFTEHNFPYENYGVLTVSECTDNYVNFEEVEQFGNHPSRFELHCTKDDIKPYIPEDLSPDTFLGDIFTKDTNPKDAVGTGKPPLSTVSGPVLAEVGLAMLEGARKYGRHNYRVAGVRASVYYDATMRHLIRWFEGEDVDPDSGLSHVTKAIASLVVLRDAMINDKITDDRPPSSKEWYEELEKKAKEILDKYPNAVPAHTIEDTNND